MNPIAHSTIKIIKNIATTSFEVVISIICIPILLPYILLEKCIERHDSELRRIYPSKYPHRYPNL